MRQLLPLFTGLVLVLAGGIVHAVWTDRWSLMSEPADSVAKLPQVSMHLGDWEGADLPPLPADVVGIGEIAGNLNRRYTHRRTGATLSMLVLCGRAGPIGQHTPEVCYGGEGFGIVGGRRNFNIDPAGGPNAEFSTGLFTKLVGGNPVNLRILWTWGAGGKWHTPNSPRLTFGKYPAIYKLYLVRENARDDEKIEEDPCVDFAKVLMPELQRALFKSP
jgi:hypothetical protein